MKRHIFTASLGILLTNFAARAEFIPEIQLSGKGVSSANINLQTQSFSLVPDFSDSTLMLGLRQKLYSDWRSTMVMGVQLPDADSGLGDLFLSQTFLQLENKNQVLKAGRSRARTNLIDFPTLRDDDAISFAYVLNPFSAGKNTQDHQYANVLEYSYVYNQRFWFSTHGENFIDFEKPDNFALNALGAAIEYKVPQSQVWNREWLQYAGLSFYNFFPNSGPQSNFSKPLNKIAAGLSLNMLPDPVHFMDLKGQFIYNLGHPEITAINSFSEYTQSQSMASFWTLRYLYRKLERPFLQSSLGIGFRSFPNNPSQSFEWTALANFFYRLGENLDLGLQYRYLNAHGDLQQLEKGNEHRVQLALVYSFDTQFFNQFDDRNSLLNLEHTYLP